MTKDQLEKALLLEVVTRFHDFNQSVSRYSLVLKFEGQPALTQVLYDLQARSLLIRQNQNVPTDEEEYLPGALAFELCGDKRYREEAKSAVTVVLHTLRQMYKKEHNKQFTLDDLERYAAEGFPGKYIDRATVKFGLYIAKGFNVLTSYGPPDGVEVAEFRIAEWIMSIPNLDAEWDTMVDRSTPRVPQVAGAFTEIEEDLRLVLAASNQNVLPTAQVNVATATASPSLTFTEDVVLTKVPELNGVFALLRRGAKNSSEEVVLVDSGVLRNKLILLFRTGNVPSASSFQFQTCSVGSETDLLLQQWKRKMPKAYGAKWKPLGRTLGEGGQSRIQLVEDITGNLPGQYALKLLKSIGSSQARARFKGEVDATQRISHPHVLAIYDADLESATPYYVAEFCEGESLLKAGAGAFRGDLKQALSVLLPILDALTTAHSAGIIHRDIKPANILFRSDGTPVLGDFGICYLEGGEPVTLSNEAVGSRYYLAPEMEAGNRGLGEPSDKTDVYSFGKVLFWMLSGGKKFERENHRGTSLVELLGDQRFEHVHMLLDRMVTYEPKQRLKSTELRTELLSVVSLVDGNYSPLKPSMGIRCRFCGIGKYEKWSSFDSTDPKRAMPLQPISKLGLQNYAGANFRILRCSHCGHADIFQFESIKAPNWWNS
jgi:Protein kinase domain